MGWLPLCVGEGESSEDGWDGKRAALTYKDGPSLVALTRQAVAIIDRDASGLHRGGYVLLEADGNSGGDPHPSGSEVGRGCRCARWRGCRILCELRFWPYSRYTVSAAPSFR